MRSPQNVRAPPRTGHFNVPHFGGLWQSDLNLYLARWGLGHGVVFDMCTRTVVVMEPIYCKLPTYIWTEVNMQAVLRHGGFPDLWTTGALRLDRLRPRAH